MGAEMSIGLSITGLCKSPPVTLSGAKTGDVLVLTKPIGSGTLMAADMRGLARGEDVQACLDMMAQPQGNAAQILAKAHAMTDVTGFGLAGHLAGMCEASGVGMSIQLADVPLLDGALDLATQGVRSSLYPDNRAIAGIIAPDTPNAALMFDPQTGGGLLAAISPAQAMKLKDAPNIHVIGEVTDWIGVTFDG